MDYFQSLLRLGICDLDQANSRYVVCFHLGWVGGVLVVEAEGDYTAWKEAPPFLVGLCSGFYKHPHCPDEETEAWTLSDLSKVIKVRHELESRSA